MPSPLQLLLNLFKWTWKFINFIRVLILNVIFFSIFLIFVAAYHKYQDPPQVYQGGALVLNIAGSLVEQPDEDQNIQQLKRELSNNIDINQKNSVYEITQLIATAAEDEEITGLILSLNNFTGADLPTLQYVGQYLEMFKASGKPIYAMASSYNQSQYYLASFATEIYIEPQGSVNVYGFSAENLYYKSLLDKLKVNTHIFRVGTYKSAVEPFMRDNMSDEAKTNTSRWLNTMWDSYLADISNNRQLLPTQLVPDTAKIVQRMQAVAGDSTAYAKEYKFVDAIISRADFERKMIEEFRYNSKTKTFYQVNIYDYKPYNYSSIPENHNQIAVIFADGTIIDGNTQNNDVGSDTVVRQLRQARLDDKIKAIVLRVNSPGGSVTASEAIRSELMSLRHANKPIVVSMGGLAASGGYWISTPADYIFASPNTLTGSIGIFGMIPTFENSLEHIGVHTDGVSTSSLASLSQAKALSPEFKQLIQLNIESGYKTFIHLVAKARNKTSEEVDQIAQGQVWIGSDAKNNGLVDELGDFDDAVQKASDLANITDFELKWFYTNNNLLNNWLGNIQLTLQSWLVGSLLPNNLTTIWQKTQQEVKLLDSFNDPQNRYVYCLECADIR